MKINLLSSLLFLSLATLTAKDYYVAIDGDNNNTGTEEARFQTITKAASVMTSGDVCYIDEGVYPESITPRSSNQTFKAITGKIVEITGFDQINKWSLHQEHIYTAKLSTQLNDRNQLLFDGQMMNLARWPNKTDYNPFNIEALKAYGGNNYISYSAIPEQNWAEGGVLFFLGKSRWTSWRTHITEATDAKISFNDLSSNWDWGGSHNPSGGGEFFLQNTLEALDSEGEWFIDRDMKQIYFWAPNNLDPNVGESLVRARVTAFNLNNKSGITLEGLRITGANVTLEGASNCHVKYCDVLYGNHTIASTSSAMLSDGSVKLSNSSSNNLIELNNIQWGAANGIILKGSGNEVRNNYIGNFNYLGSYACPVELRGANDLLQNEIFNAGRDAIRGGGNGSDCGYNNIHHSNLINDDCGGIYMCCGTFGYTRIHHNWIHDIQSRDTPFNSYKGTGVYLDNSTKNVIVDHNVMWNLEWTCIQINWEGENQLIYNNTLWSNDGPKSEAMGRWVNGYELINVKLYNTLSNKGGYDATDINNTVEVGLNADVFEDFEGQDFIPKAASAAIDAGRSIVGYTEGHIGTSPDAGAYERGKERWVAGPDWSLQDNSNIDSLAFRETFDNTLAANDSYKIPVVYFAKSTSVLKLSILSEDSKLVAETEENIYKGTGTIYVDLKLVEFPEESSGYTLSAKLLSADDVVLYTLDETLTITAPIPPVSLQLSPSGNQFLKIGQTVQYEVSTLPSNASLGLKWSSSSPSVAFMDDKNQLHAIGEGTSVITATAYDGTSALFAVSVTVPVEQRFISKTNWEVIYVDSESTQGFGGEDRHKAIDGDESTFWHTQWKNTKDPLPHDIQVDMKESNMVEEIYYLPRQDDYGPNGTIGSYQLYVSNSNTEWGSPAATGTFSFPTLESDKSNLAAFKERKKITLESPKQGRYFRLVALTETQSDPNIPFTAVAELDVIATKSAKLDDNALVQVGIYPNPVNDHVSLTGIGSFQTIKADIYTLSGNLLSSNKIGSNSNIDVSSLEVGVYILRIETDNHSKVLRFVKAQN